MNIKREEQLVNDQNKQPVIDIISETSCLKGGLNSISKNGVSLSKLN
jgi:hypothetical protein